MNEHQLKLAEEALRASEERFRGTFENAAVGIVHNDSTGRFLLVNEKFCSIVGYSREELLQKSLQDIIHPEDLAAFVEVYESCFALEKAPRSGMERRYLRKDGTTIWIEAFASFQRDESGCPTYAIGVIQDISDRKRLEEELRQTNALLQGLADGTQDAVYVKDLAGKHLMFNAAASRLVGKPIAEVLGRDDTAIFDAEGARIVMAHDRQVMETGTAASYEHELTSGGVTRTYLSSKAPYCDGQGNVIGLIGICHDITERKRLEQELRLATARLELAVRGSNIGIWDIDMPDGEFQNGRIDYVNIWEQLGYERPESSIDQGAGMALVHPDDRATHEEAIRKYMAGETSEFEVEGRVCHKDGSYRWMISRGVAVRDAGGKPIRFLGTGIDITDRKRAEEALRQANIRVKLAVRSSDICIWDCDMPDGRIENAHLTLFNVWESLGYDAQTSPTDFASAFGLFFHPDDQERVGRELQELLVSDGEEWKNEYRALAKDGSVRWQLARGTVVRDSEGQPVRFIGTCIDITALKVAEEALRERERELNSLMGHLPGLAYRALTDEQWTALFASKGVEDLTGYAADEFISRRLHYEDMILPEDRRSTREAVLSALTGRRMYEVEHRIRHKDGSVRWIWARGHGVFAPDGSLRFIEGLNLDMTRQKRSEEALRESEEALRMSEQRFRTMASVVPVMIWTTTPDGALDYVNAYLTDHTGLPLEQILNGAWQMAIHADDLPLCIELWNRSIASGSRFDIEYRIHRADGVYRWHLSRGLPLRDDSGRVVKWFGSTVDIDDQKRAAEALREAKEVAEAANRAKDDFLANVSHEIRTPMNAIIGMTELVLDTPLDEDQRQGLKTVKSAADSLLGIINDLLDFSKIEAGKLDLVHADFSLRGAVGDTLRALAVRAHKKGLELIYQIQPDIPDALIGDAGRLRQVLLNLAGNAVKFTEEGEVVVHVEIAQRDGPPPSGDATEVVLKFTVRDTGIGIPHDQQDRIFLAFEQEDISTTRKYGGTGLGLTIAARLVALMGGTISVESGPGHGSTFAFTVRLGRQPHQPEPLLAHSPNAAAARLRNLPVLVVDDNATNRHILEEWLRDWQMEPTAVADGMAAMDSLWHRAANGRPHALVLLDARMPGADGLTVAAMIRERAELAPTRIILLTSGERTGDPARIRELQIDAQLLKPVQQDELLDTIYRVMSRTPGNTPPSGWSTPRQQASAVPIQAATPVQILVGEDNELSAQVLEQALVRQGHHVRLAENGRDVLALAEQGGFDLLLLDVHMPELDGFQVVHAVRERESTTGGHLPIIALTARSRKEDRERCLAAGMDDFQTKPIRPVDLLAVIDRVLRMYPPRRRDLFDVQMLLAACDNDPTLLRKMCQTITARVPEHLAAMRDALRDQDAPRLREVAHKCCGMLSEFSTAAGDLAGQLEDLAASTHLDKCHLILQQLETLAGELIKQTVGITVEELQRQAEGLEESN